MGLGEFSLCSGLVTLWRQKASTGESTHSQRKLNLILGQIYVYRRSMKTNEQRKELQENDFESRILKVLGEVLKKGPCG